MPRGRPRKQNLGDTYYAKNQARQLAGVKARQAALGEAYRIANLEQIKRNSRKRRAALPPGQTEFPLENQKTKPSKN